MDVLHNFWNIISTENEQFMKYILVILGFIESFVTMKFFTTFLNIEYTKKQKNIYIIIMEIIMGISILLIPNKFSVFVHLFLTFFVIKFVFKISTIKSIIAEIIPMIVITLVEIIYVKLCFALFNFSMYDCSNIIIYRVPYMLSLYLTIFLLSKLIKFIKLNFSAIEKLSKHNKRLLMYNLILVIICIGIQFYLVIFYMSILPTAITLLSLFFSITYSLVSIYSIIKSSNYEITKTNLEQSELHNKTLELLYNNLRAFKHDFHNIITAFGGYVYAKDMNGLTKYYEKILDECHINNNLSTLNPQIINNAAIYNILASKYYKADELKININLNIFIDLNKLKMDIYDFSRILGILLDNSIEAASQCKEKIIKIEIRDFKQRHCQILTIENTYCNKDIDIKKIYENGYTSKSVDKENHGIGLWQVSKIVKKHSNVLLDTSNSNKFFKQELAIYYK